MLEWRQRLNQEEELSLNLEEQEILLVMKFNNSKRELLEKRKFDRLSTF